MSTHHVEMGSECVIASQFLCTSKSVERYVGMSSNLIAVTTSASWMYTTSLIRQC